MASTVQAGIYGQPAQTLGVTALLAGFFLALMAFTKPVAATPLLNGDFEINDGVVLSDGRIRFTGWTTVFTNGGYSGIAQEVALGGGGGGLSALNIESTRFDGAASAAPDPLAPFQSDADPQLDNFGYARPSGPAPTNSFADLFSDVFTIDSDVSIDVWREGFGAGTDAFTRVQVFRASDDLLLNSFTVTSALNAWSRVTFSTAGLIGTDAYLVLRGGTNAAGLGFLSLFDNVQGGVTQAGNIPEAGGGSIAVPETETFITMAIGLLLLAGGRALRIEPVQHQV